MENKINSAVKNSTRSTSLPDLLIKFSRVWEGSPNFLAKKVLNLKTDKANAETNDKYIRDYMALLVKSNELFETLYLMIKNINEIDGEISQLMKHLEVAENKNVDTNELQTIKKQIKKLKAAKEEILNFGVINGRDTWKDRFIDIYKCFDSRLDYCQYGLRTSEGCRTSEKIAKEMASIFEESVGFDFTESKRV